MDNNEKHGGLIMSYEDSQRLYENENDDENEKHGFLQTAMLLRGGRAEWHSQH